MSSVDVLNSLIGPTVSVLETSSLGGAFGQYEQDFAKYNNHHWDADGAGWEAANYYDRAFVNYVWYDRTGDQVYLDRANALATDYLNNYVEANNYGAASWWSMPKGIAAHYLHTGDQASLTAIGKMADQAVNPWNTENNWANLFDPHQSEGREQARTLETLTQAILIDAPSDGVPNIQPNGEDWGVSGGNDFRALAKSLVDKILTSEFQKADGSRPHYVDGPAADGSPIDKPFMNGLVNEALMNYYEQVEADPRIVSFIKSNLDYMWANEWDASAKAFQYIDEASSTGEQDVPAADLNMLIVNGFGFVYKHTGDETYLQRGDVVFEGGVEGNWLEGSKQFNQQYANSYNYIAYTRGEQSGTLPETDAGFTPTGLTLTGTEAADVLVGGVDNDTINGLGGNDRLSGGDGDDELLGMAGNDKLFGEAGDDRLNGGAGNDTLNGNVGNDHMDGGAGDDLYIVAAAGDVVVEAAGGGTDTVRSYINLTLPDNVERLQLEGSATDGTGNALANTLIGNSLNNVLDGKAGKDDMRGGAGDDIYIVTGGGDKTIEHAGQGTDTVRAYTNWTLANNVERLELQGSSDLTGAGNKLDNTLVGNAGANVLSGGGGNDTIDGGAGRDVLTGGAGKDIFQFNLVSDSRATAASRDIISDFARGADRIDLRNIDANTNVAKDQAFSFIGTQAFSGKAGELNFVDKVLSGDVDGDKIADFAVQVNGVSDLTTTDFFPL